MELWKPIYVAGSQGVYEVSSLGAVRRIGSERILRPMRTGTRRKGSQRSKVRLSTVPRVDMDVAHLVLTAFAGPRPVDGCAMHADDDPTNNRIDNLCWGTYKENARDMARKGRGGIQFVSPQMVREIIERRNAGERGRALAGEYGISEQHVCNLYKRRTILSKELE